MIDDAATVNAREKAVATKDDKERSEARQKLLDLFPSIPTEEVEPILNYAFEKCSGRVGRTSRVGYDVKIKLAVHAHIRHRFTSYESLLRGGVKHQFAGISNIRDKARKLVASRIQQVAHEWRAEVTELMGSTRSPPPALRATSEDLTNLSDKQRQIAKSLQQPAKKYIDAY